MPAASSPTPSSRGSTISTSSETPETPTRANGRRVYLLAVVVGVALGVFSILADGIIPGRLVTLLGNIAAPWAIAAFAVGYRATSVKQGALAGALALVVGIVTYYAGAAIRDYGTATNVVWTVVALVAGPILGACAAAISTHRDRPPVVAIALPSAMLVAEGFFLLVDRKIWRSDFGAETYRLIDIGVILALVVGGLVLPWVFLKDRASRAMGYVLTVAGGAFGAFLFVLLQRLIVAVV